MKNSSLLSALVVLPISGLLLAGCSTSAQSSAPDSALSIVATTNVYADIAAQVAGPDIQVTEVITSSAQDPHSYEPTARDKLTVSNASLVIANGGGYDPFMDSLVSSLPKEDSAKVDMIHAVDSSPVAHEGEEAEDFKGHEGEDDHDASDGHGHDHADYNEHIWYDLDSMAALAEEIAEHLGEADEANAATYQANAKKFNEGIEKLRGQLDQAGLKDKSYMMTEPVPFHLLEDAKMVNKTPAGLSEAIEEGQGIAPLTMKQSDELLETHGVDMLLYNTQTEGAETQSLRAQAETAKVPVVELSETILDDSSYLEWMASNIDALASANKD